MELVDLPVDRVIALPGAAADALAPAIARDHPDLAPLVTRRTRDVTTQRDFVHAAVTELEQAAVALLPAWLPEAADVSRPDINGLAAARLLAVDLARHAHFPVRLLADLAVLALTGRRPPGQTFPVRVRAAALARLVATAFGRRRVVLLVDQADATPPEHAAVTAGAQWLVHHGGPVVWLLDTPPTAADTLPVLQLTTKPPANGVFPGNRGLARPASGLFPANKGLAPPADGVFPGNRGLEPPADGVFPGNRGLGPPADGVFPGNRGLEPPTNGVFPGNRGLGPPADGVFPGNRGLGPPADGVFPGNRGLGPPADGVFPGNRGLAPPTDGVFPGNTGPVGQPHPASRAEAALEAALAAEPWATGRTWNQTYHPHPLTAPMRLDLLWPAERCVVEIDGPEHCRPEHFEADRRRDVRLQLDGYAVLRFTNARVLHDLGAVVHQIGTFLQRRRTAEGRDHGRR